MNDIKLNALATTLQTKTERKEQPVSGTQLPIPPRASAEADITVSNKLGTIANKMVADSTIPDNSHRIQELKQLIHTDQYKVDLNALANKLSKSMLILNS